jgi:DNA polymerase-3 subunit delta
MTADQLISQLGRSAPAPAYLFIGPESYRRDECRRSLLEKVLGDADREEGFQRLDLDETPLAAVIDDACSLSLFAPKRLIWAGRAEAALPRGRAAAATEDDDAKPAAGDAAAIESYVKNPVPGVVIVFDSSRFEFEGEDKAKVERVRKFYSSIRDVVEFPRYSPMEARKLATDLARTRGLRIASAELQLLCEATGNSATTIATEIEKLALFAADGKAITAEVIAQLVPQAGSTTIFALVAALGRKDRMASLTSLDTLVRNGEYLPLALAFLATQFRQALVAAEAGLRGAGQVQSHFSKMGVPMWGARAEQIAQTAGAFRPAEMKEALKKLAEADVGLKDIRPDDRIVMEEFVLSLTARSA